MGAVNHPAYHEELAHLRQTRAEVSRQLADLQAVSRLTIEGEDLDDASMHGIRAAEAALEDKRLLELRRLALAAQQPYFGRVDLQADDQDAPERLYIGKIGVAHSTQALPLIVDWRAPVAAVFYSGADATGQVAYTAPAGTIGGTLTLKRHLMIRGGRLQHIADSQVSGEGPVLGDTHLLYALQESRDGRLKDIVATIQAEQNAIIRADADRPLIVQGRAGSGKTSVALHRVAYLLYARRESIAAERILIFGPNRIFMDYIADVLPELGVGGVQQVTFADWAIGQLGRAVQLADPGDRLEAQFAPGSDGASGRDSAPGSERHGRYKGSVAFQAALTDALEHYTRTDLVPAADLELWPGACLPAAVVAEWFYHRDRDWPLNLRRRRTLARIKRWALQQAAAHRGSDAERPRRRAALLALRRYTRLWPRHDAVSLYRRLLADAPGVPPAVSADTLQTLQQGLVLATDLAALLHLHWQLNGRGAAGQWDHVVVDEAQDFSPFQVALLQRLARSGGLTIVGDLAQGIDPHTGIDSWQSLQALFTPAAAYHELRLSYRSTHQIVNFANHVLARAAAGAGPAEPVYRPGPPVRLGQPQEPDFGRALAREVQRLKGAHTSIAVVGRTRAECERLYKALTAARFRPQRITAHDDRYRGGLSVIPCYLARGMEFDAVVVADASAAAYRDTVRDARLLYVVLTRALHELTVFWQGEISPLLADLPADLYAGVE